MTRLWIVLAAVVIGGLVALWVANAARLARATGQLHRRSPGSPPGPGLLVHRTPSRSRL